MIWWWWSIYSILLIFILFLFTFRRSLPFSWTIRMLIPYWRLRLRNLNKRYNPQSNSNQQQFQSTSAQGCDPFEDQVSVKCKATIDECDFMGHLSNSSYPKNLDFARVYYSFNRLTDFISDGGWVALGSTSFVFHQEIPILSNYQIVMKIETWNDKWLYLKSEFKGKNRKGENVLYCTAITKHCFKFGRKTIPPWFVLAYCGYSSTSSETLIKTNSTRSKELRLSLQDSISEKRSNSKNPLECYQKYDPIGVQRSPLWCSQDQWDVAGWESQRKAGLMELANKFL